MHIIVKFVRRYLRLFFMGVGCLCVEAFCDLLQPTILSKLVDADIASGQMDHVLRRGLLMLGVTAVGACAAVGRNYLATHVSLRFGRDMRNALFTKVQSFSFENIDHFDPATLVTRLTNDVTQLQTVVNGAMRIFVKAPIMCIGAITMMIVLNAPMALVLAAVLPVVAMLIYMSMRIGIPYFSRVQKGLDGLNAAMREYLSGVRVIKAFNRFMFERKRFAKANEELSQASIRAMRVMAFFSPGISLTVNLGLAAILLLGGYRVSAGSVHVGQVMAFINYMAQVLMALSMISAIFTMFVRAGTSARRVSEVMDEQNTMPEPESPAHPDITGGIRFQDVTFSYAGAPDTALRHISFACNPGQTVGIIGSTGSGKSTLVNLIPRFYDVQEGAVLIDGVDVRTMDTRLLRDTIALVPQKSLLFTGTIMENLRWGKEDASQQELEQAAQAAQAHDFIASFPERYQTLLGQGGVNLSGGQKQRMSIARALLKKPRILILDDCTSAVDVTTESRIRGALRSFARDLTCLIISQRITSVMHSDIILVMENGEMAGMGGHNDLMRDCSVYRDIYRSQIGEEDVPDANGTIA